MKVCRKIEYVMEFSTGLSNKCRATIDHDTGILTVDMGILGKATLLRTEVLDLYRFIREHHPAFQELSI